MVLHVFCFLFALFKSYEILQRAQNRVSILAAIADSSILYTML